MYKRVSPNLKEPGRVAVYDRDDRDLQSVDFKGTICSDEFHFPVREFQRLTKYSGNFLSIMDAQ